MQIIFTHTKEYRLRILEEKNQILEKKCQTLETQLRTLEENLENKSEFSRNLEEKLTMTLQNSLNLENKNEQLEKTCQTLETRLRTLEENLENKNEEKFSGNLEEKLRINLKSNLLRRLKKFNSLKFKKFNQNFINFRSVLEERINRTYHILEEKINTPNSRDEDIYLKKELNSYKMEQEIFQKSVEDRFASLQQQRIIRNKNVPMQFCSKSVNSSYFNFSADFRKVVRDSQDNNKWIHVPSNSPLPNNRKVRFNVKVEYQKSGYIMVGILHSDHLDSKEKDIHMKSKIYSIQIENGMILIEGKLQNGIPKIPSGEEVMVIFDYPQKKIGFYFDGYSKKFLIKENEEDPKYYAYCSFYNILDSCTFRGSI